MLSHLHAWSRTPEVHKQGAQACSGASEERLRLFGRSSAGGPHLGVTPRLGAESCILAADGAPALSVHSRGHAKVGELDLSCVIVQCSLDMLHWNVAGGAVRVRVLMRAVDLHACMCYAQERETLHSRPWQSAEWHVDACVACGRLCGMWTFVTLTTRSAA
jgi:hypothetical protein